MLQRLRGLGERALSWGSKRTGMDLSYVARGSFWLTTAQGVSAIAGLALAVAFANLLPKETYGVYRFVLSGAAIFAATSFSGLNTALIRSVAQGFYGSYFATFLERVKWSVLGAVAAVAAALYYYTNENDVLALSFLIVAIFTPFSDALNVFGAFRSGLKDFRYGAVAEITTRAIGALALIATLLLTDNVLILVLAYFFVYTFLRLLFFLHTARYAVKLPSVSPEKDSTIAYGKHLSIMYLISAVAAHADKIAVFHFSGAAALAAYAFAIVIPDQLRTSIKNVAVLAFPKFSTHEEVNVHKGLPRKNLFVGLGVFAIVIVYILIAPYLFAAIFPTYSESVPLTQLVALSLIDALTLLPLSAMKAHRRTKELYSYHITVGAVQVACIGIGGAIAGLYGVVGGLLIGRIFAVLYLVVIMRPLQARAP